jgi:hypothetical protein
MDRVDTEIALAAERGGTRCRVEIFPRPAEERPVVILTELDDNPGLPLSATVRELAAAVTAAFLPDGADPVWIEAWQGRAVAALVRGRLGVTTFMAVDPRPDRPTRRPVHPGWVAELRRAR